VQSGAYTEWIRKNYGAELNDEAKVSWSSRVRVRD
jgi:hypothetical protein